MIENESIELKREFVDGIKHEIIAFANSEGGKIFIGINDDGTVYGVEDVDDTMLRVSNLIRGNIKPDVSMFVKISAEKLEGKDVVVIDVRRGSARPSAIIVLREMVNKGLIRRTGTGRLSCYVKL